MAQVFTRTIRIVPRAQGWIGLVLGQVIVWGFLLGSVGGSRVWFGGAVVIDVLAFIFALTIAILLGNRLSGREAHMTPTELRDYVNAGCPVDAKSWVEAHRIYGSRLQ